MLSKLLITQRLSLLLLLVLGSLLLTCVPFAIQRADDARAAAAVVGAAADAQAVGGVVRGIQRERTLALGYLTSPRLRRTALIEQIAAARNLSDLFRRRSTWLLPGLDRLDGLRGLVLVRNVSAAEAARVYHDVIVGLVDSLHLTEQAGADTTGQRQLESLDALLRSDEEAGQIATSLIVGTVDRPAAAAAIAASSTLHDFYLKRFRQESVPASAAVVDAAVSGPTAQAVTALAAMTGAGPTGEAVLDRAMSAATAYVSLRSIVESGITNDILSRAGDRAAQARGVAAGVACFGTTLMILVIWLGTAVSRSVARPLRRITTAATAVADLATRELARVGDIDAEDDHVPQLAALTLRSAGEIGELAAAFNRVQATAALLMEQQARTRRNVAVMFANVAHRTSGLVARQLAQIDELERDEADEKRLANLYRLDHLTTRLRRSADSLLVIAGARESGQLSSPMPLADVLRSAVAEVEGYRNVRLGSISDVTVVASAVPDLTLLLAEVLENATAFSPPGATVEISAEVWSDGVIHVVDRGLGMTAEQLAAENRRLVAAERLDIAPTAMLGLLVVGRLARRHNVRVRLLPTPGGGVTVEAAVPAELFLSNRPTSGSAQRPPMLDRPGAGVAIERGAAPSNGRHAVPPGGDEDFGWFDRQRLALAAAAQHRRHDGPPGQAEQHDGSASPPGDGDPGAVRGGLRRRQPGASQVDIGRAPVRPARPAERDAEAERAGLDAFAAGAARAARSPAALAPPAAPAVGVSRGARPPAPTLGVEIKFPRPPL
jgi:signal transduction histidine kinase